MAEMETIRETVTVLEERIEYLKQGVAKLNKKALKLGCEPMDLTFAEDTKTQLYEMRNGQIVGEGDLNKHPSWKIVRTYFTIEATLEYIIPIIDGWELITTFDIMPALPKLDESGKPIKDAEGLTIYGERAVFTSTVPGKELPAEFQDKHEIHCDHCGHKRFRTHSMLMRHVDTGEFKEVGSTCVKDFFGHSPAGLMFMAQLSFWNIVREDEEEYNTGGRGVYLQDLHAVLQFTALSVRLDGWVSKGMAAEKDYLEPTAFRIDYYIHPMGKNAHLIPVPSDDDVNLASATIAYFSELNPGDNDYLTNCKKLVEINAVPDKMLGVACSMIASYKRTLKETLEREERPESNWVGKVGERLDVNVTCVWSKEFPGDWGVSVLYIMVDEATGNKFKTFYSGHKWSLLQGDTCTIKGTVKAHETFKDEKSTSLTRCSITNLIEAPEAIKDAA